MKNTKNVKILLFAFIMMNSNLIFSQSYDHFNRQTTVIVPITIPKSGTHLLQKCLNLINGELRINNEKNIMYSHAKYDEEALNNFKVQAENNNLILFLMIRDPRDQMISLIYYIFTKWLHSDPPLRKPGNYFANYKDLTFDELIICLTCFGSSWYNTILWENRISVQEKESLMGISNFYNIYLDWLRKSPYNICVVKFENLVGPMGGGSSELQKNEIKKIAAHLGYQLTAAQLNKVTSNLFGSTFTFREGQIGSWKKHFKDIHKKCFKEVAGQLLIDLGYEQDLDW